MDIDSGLGSLDDFDPDALRRISDAEFWAIIERALRATPGPWSWRVQVGDEGEEIGYSGTRPSFHRWYKREMPPVLVSLETSRDGAVPIFWTKDSSLFAMTDGDAEFLCRARTDVLLLAGMVQRLVAKTRDPLFINALREMPYCDYLKTEHWRQLRDVAFIHYGRRCQICNATERLHVHHRTYERRGEELIEDLTVLCAECHARFHCKLPEPAGQAHGPR